MNPIDIKSNIEKLLNSGVTNYRIYKDTGISQSTLSDIKNGVSELDNMKLGVALKLNEYYLKEMCKRI